MAFDSSPALDSESAPSPVAVARAPRTAVLVAILLALCAFSYFYGLGSRPIWDIDEGEHAAASKHIVQSGDWIVPYVNGEPFLDKPILHNWFIALAFLALGFTAFAARLPAALLGTGCVLLAYVLGRRMFGRLAGFFGAAVLATSALQVLMSRVVVHDVSLEFFVAATLLAFHVIYRSERPRLGSVILFWVLLGFAVFAKGLVGLVVPGLPIGILILRDRRFSFIREMRPVLGLVIAAAVAAPWYVAMDARVPGYAYYFFVERHFGGFLHGDVKGSKPIWTYVPILLGGMLPWTFLLPTALWRAIRDRKSAAGGDLVFLLAWFGAGFTFFSLSSAKLPTYILPLILPLALLLGRVWGELFETRAEDLRRAFLRASSFLTVVLVGGGTVLWFVPITRLQQKYDIAPALLAGLVSAVAVLAVVGFVAIRRSAYRWHFAAYVAIPVLLVAAFVHLLAPLLNPHRASKEMALLIDHVLPPGESAPVFCYMKDALMFYTPRHVEILPKTPDLVRLMNSPGRQFCLVDQDDIQKALNSGAPVFIVAHYGDTYIVSNRKGELAIPAELQERMR